MVSSTPRPHFTPGKDPVPIVPEAGWAPGPVWKDGKSRLHRDSIPDRPAPSQSLYRLSYPTHGYYIYHPMFGVKICYILSTGCVWFAGSDEKQRPFPETALSLMLPDHSISNAETQLAAFYFNNI